MRSKFSITCFIPSPLCKTYLHGGNADEGRIRGRHPQYAIRVSQNTQANIICNCDMCLSMIYPTFLAGIVSGKGIKEYNSWADYAILSQ